MRLHRLISTGLSSCVCVRAYLCEAATCSADKCVNSRSKGGIENALRPKCSSLYCHNIVHIRQVVKIYRHCSHKNFSKTGHKTSLKGASDVLIWCNTSTAISSPKRNFVKITPCTKSQRVLSVKRNNRFPSDSGPERLHWNCPSAR